MTLRIERSVRQGIMVFTLSGRMNAEEVAELKALFAADYKDADYKTSFWTYKSGGWRIATQ